MRIDDQKSLAWIEKVEKLNRVHTGFLGFRSSELEFLDN